MRELNDILMDCREAFSHLTESEKAAAAESLVGKTAMSAIGFYSPLNHFLFALSIMLVSGSQLLVGKALGRNLLGMNVLTIRI